MNCKPFRTFAPNPPVVLRNDSSMVGTGAGARARSRQPVAYVIRSGRGGKPISFRSRRPLSERSRPIPSRSMTKQEVSPSDAPWRRMEAEGHTPSSSRNRRGTQDSRQEEQARFEIFFVLGGKSDAGGKDARAPFCRLFLRIC